MGADARWVCHTCMTICARGGTHIFKSIPEFSTVEEVRLIKDQFCDLMQTIELVTDNEERYISFFDDLMIWLKRHEGHNTHIGSSYSTDMMDDEDYRNETLSGHVDTMTRGEKMVGMEVEARVQTVEDIKGIIDKHGSNTQAAAQELYDKFETWADAIAD